MQRFRADWIWTPGGPQRGGEVVVDGRGRIAEVRVSALGEADASSHAGLLVPGFVNAHAHLELSDLRTQVIGGQGLSTWAMALLARRRPPQDEAILAAIDEAYEAGTAAIIDTTNSGAPLPLLADSPLRGLGQIELIGIEPERCEAARGQAARLMLAPGIPAVETCHAAVSCSAELIAQVLRPTGHPGPAQTFHCDEDPEDGRLLREQEGSWADFLDRLGRQWRGRIGQADSTVSLLDELGVLGPHLGLVHCVHTGSQDLARIARSGSVVVLCPRSNLHIGGRLPDVPAMVAQGIPLAIGTDSLASAPDMDLLAEAATLAVRFPTIDPAVWIEALTIGGTRLLLDGPKTRVAALARGSLHQGAEHGLVLVSIPRTEDPAATLLDGTRWARRWLSPPVSQL